MWIADGWKDYELLDCGGGEKLERWDKFCFGLCSDHELRAVHVFKEGDEETTYLTTLFEDCIKETASYGLLVNENHLILDSHHK